MSVSLLKRLSFATTIAFAAVALPMAVFASTGPTPPTPAGPGSLSIVAGHLTSRPSVSVFRAQLQAELNALPQPTAAQVAVLEAYAAAHPHDLQILKPILSSGGGRMSTSIAANSLGFQWWGVRIYISNSFMEAEEEIIITGGFAAAGAAICAPTVIFVILCGTFGGAIGLAIAKIIWYYLPWSCPSGGFYLDYYWSGSWNAWGC